MLVLILGTVVGLLVGAVVTYAIVAAQRTPEAAASAFLDELVAGDSAGAQNLLAQLPAGTPVLLQPDTYAAATDRITGYTVLGGSTENDRARVKVEVHQGGETYTQELSLTLVRRDLGLLDVWRVDGDNLPTVYITYAHPEGMGLTVNGKEFELAAGSFEVGIPAFPGTYAFEPTGVTEYYSTEPATTTLRFDGPGSSETVAFDVTLTAAGVAAAQRAVDARLDECLAQPVLAPGPNCGFSVAEDGATYTNIRWTLLARPTVSFGAYRTGAGWAVIPVSSGSMRVDADYTSGGESGIAESVVEGYDQSGFITSIDENGVAVFESAEYR